MDLDLGSYERDPRELPGPSCHMRPQNAEEGPPQSWTTLAPWPRASSLQGYGRQMPPCPWYLLQQPDRLKQCASGSDLEKANDRWPALPQ